MSFMEPGVRYIWPPIHSLIVAGHSERELKCHSLVWGDLRTYSSDLAQWNLPNRSILWEFPVLALKLGPPPGLKIRWDICHLTTFNSHLAFGFSQRTKNCWLFSFLSQSIFEGRCFLRPFWATLNTVFCMMSKTLAKHRAEKNAGKSSRSLYRRPCCSGFEIIWTLWNDKKEKKNIESWINKVNTFFFFLWGF